ncbi:hypothetical protein [Cohnella abietis]|uniref:BIG2 domain-containing protein n=1 Tax=Cohnella abietis TaxID=2507935 RepID=A0A3T1D158_9BACL|nr:hypothetical protein [Cohnella abietis]BBI31749.1 hypothetical protein KCTCHS21_11480 [Cohnella abietis]
MKMWSKTAKHKSPSSRPSNIYNRILTVFLVLALIGSTFGGVVSAADITVTNLDISSDNSSGKLYVEDNTILLTANASISGESTPRVVTEDATWSSSSSAVKVVKGVVTATGAISSATITAKYKDKSAYFYVTAEYYYTDVKLKTGDSGVDAPAKQDVNIGTDLKFTVSATKLGGATEIPSKPQWTTSNAAIATVSEGTVTLLTEGTVTITVKSKGKSDSIVLTVSSPYSSIDIVGSDDKVIEGPIHLVVDDNKEITLKSKATLKDGIPEPASAKEVWTSSNTAIVKIGEAGKLDAGKLTAVSKGTATITISRLGVSKTITVIVRTEYEALTVTPDKPIYVTLYGSSVELGATAMKGSDKPEPVTTKAEWKISDTDQAYAVIDKTTTPGKVFVSPRGVGTAKIIATYMGLSKEISITVLPTIKSIEISKDSLEVFVEDTAALPSVSGTTVSDGKEDVGKLVKWTSSDLKVITIEDGKWKAVSKGTAILTAEVESVSGTIVRDTMTIEVHNKILALIPSTDTLSVVIGKEVDLPTVQLIYEDGEETPVTDKIVWKSSTPNLLVKTKSVKGLLAANATLTGTYLNKTIKVKVTVEEEFTSFVIEPNKISLTLNKSQSIKVTGNTKSGKKVNISSRLNWIASNVEHVTIKGASIKGLVEGSGKLTATIQGKILEIPYVITAKLTKLTASNNAIQSAIGDQVVIELTSLYENGKSANVNVQAVWTTSKASVAVVENGRITVKGKGSATIKAAFGGKSVSIRVSVK